MVIVYIQRMALDVMNKFSLLPKFRSGAKKIGWNISIDIPPNIPTQDDILITLNRTQEHIIKPFEMVGAKVLVIESHYLKPVTDNLKWLSFGFSYTNNIKYAPKCLDNGERFSGFGLEIQPWRKNGEHILFPTQSKIFNQQSFGWKNWAQPAGADEDIIRRIRKLSDRKIIFRIHPNSRNNINHVIGKNVTISNFEGKRSMIYEDLKNSWATVVWTSNAATESLLEGVPVFVCGPGIFLKDVCNMGLDRIENPLMPDGRLELFSRMAWSQFSSEEIESGFAFDCLLS